MLFPVLHYCYCSLSASSATRTASDITHVAVVEVRIAVMKDCLAGRSGLKEASDLLSTVNVQVHVHSNLSFLAAGHTHTHTQDKALQ